MEKTFSPLNLVLTKTFFPGEMIGKYGYERIYFIVENVLFCFVDRVFARICRLF